MKPKHLLIAAAIIAAAVGGYFLYVKVRDDIAEKKRKETVTAVTEIAGNIIDAFNGGGE